MSITQRFLNYPSNLLKLPFSRRYSPIFRHSDNILTVTESACNQLSLLRQKFPEKRLRIAVEAGGCKGFQYKFSLEKLNELNESDPDNTLFKLSPPDTQKYSADLSLICDNVSFSMIKDAKLDYSRELIGSAFKIIDNPEVQSGCGCGVSFDIKK